jgi:uncharacterized protein (TIGR02270 family)
LDGQEEVAVRILDVLQHVKGPLQEALVRALVLAEAAVLDTMLLERFRVARLDSQGAVLLEILTNRGADAGNLLSRCLDSDNERLVAAALQAAGRFGHREMLAPAESRLYSNQPSLQGTALKASLALGSRAAWDLCLQLAGGSTADDIPLLIAVLGSPAHHEILYRQLDKPERLERKLWNLGFCGTVQAGDACASYLQSKDERVAKAAAESIAWIGGLDLGNKLFRGTSNEPKEDETLPPIEEDDLDADLSLDGLDDVPVPNREAVAQWWKKNSVRLAANQRHLLGRPYSPGNVVYALENGSLWRRHALALELYIRSGGAQHVSTDAFSSRQRRQIAALTRTDAGQRSRAEA